jgi:hypothetical protein
MSLDKQKELDEFKAKCQSMTKKELEDLEQEYIKKAEEIDKTTAETMFELPTENYVAVAKGIRMFLNKQTIQWQYTLGMKILYEYWNPDVQPKEINYPTLDSTLRTIGELQFTGYEEWCAVVDINKFMEPLREKYIEVTDKVYDIAAHHNIIMDALKLNTPMGQN